MRGLTRYMYRQDGQNVALVVILIIDDGYVASLSSAAPIPD